MEKCMYYLLSYFFIYLVISLSFLILCFGFLFLLRLWFLFGKRVSLMVLLRYFRVVKNCNVFGSQQWQFFMLWIMRSGVLMLGVYFSGFFFQQFLVLFYGLLFIWLGVKKYLMLVVLKKFVQFEMECWVIVVLKWFVCLIIQFVMKLLQELLVIFIFLGLMKLNFFIVLLMIFIMFW